MPVELTASGFNRVSRSIERTLRDVGSGLSGIDPSLPEGRVRIATISSTLDATYNFLFSRLDPYLGAGELPEGVTEEMVEDAYQLLLSQSANLKARCDVMLSGVPSRTDAFPPNVATSTRYDRTSLGNNSNFLNTTLKVPKFKLPKFSGDYSQFDNFWTRFDTLINQSPNFSVIEKYEYLLDQLEGAAFKIVSHLDFKPQNYDIALRLLRERYSNPRRSISLHANCLLKLPNVTHNPVSIRTFVDTFHTHFQSLANNSLELHPPDVVFTQMLLSKFDSELRSKFENKYESNESVFPKSTHLITFLEQLALKLENNVDVTPPAVGFSNPTRSSTVRKNTSRPAKFVQGTSLVSTIVRCVVCNANEHNIFKCSRFLAQSPHDRYLVVKTKRLCTTCLDSVHKGGCKVKYKCETCNSAGHHTLLHFPKTTPIREVASSPPVTQSSATGENTCMTAAAEIVYPVKLLNILMSTCLVKLQMSPDKYVVVRAVLDSASQVSFITEHCAQILGCSRSQVRSQIRGVGSVTASSNGLTQLTVSTLANDELCINHPFVILNKITTLTPRVPVSAVVRDKIKHLILADPTFDKCSPVDCLLGADITASVLTGAVIHLGDNLPVALSTRFGFVLLGQAPINDESMITSVDNPLEDYNNCYASLLTEMGDQLHQSVQRFWECEEPPQCPQVSPENIICESYFTNTTVRLPNGRYQVRLPFKNNMPLHLGDSYQTALMRLKCLERKFNRDPKFKFLYTEFMNDYKSLGHMVPYNYEEPPKYFLPHHGVFKEHGDNSKIRVVFDAGSKTSSGFSLNDILYVGEKLQPLISDVITLFRLFDIAFVCDIEKMFRQIVVHQEDRPYQCILWRESEDQPVQIFALTTVTYGTGPAPYLALRVLRQLAIDEQNNFPLASNLILNNSFVDDFQAGGKTLQQAIEVRDQLIKILSSAGFVLKKWASSCAQIVENIPEADRITSNVVGVLGLDWHISEDYFRYPASKVSAFVGNVTKRSVLATTARLYDPGGWISPVIFKFKCFLQLLWKEPLDWDTPLPVELLRCWINLVETLSLIPEISIPRAVLETKPSSFQLHGFCDASQLGYAATLYLRIDYEVGVKGILIGSKTRVAPVKPVTIPRLELMGALLLAKLFHHYFNLLQVELNFHSAYLWTDSTIVLDWIKTPPYLLKTFVGNRVGQIQDLTATPKWLHVSSEDNPSDIASRGSNPVDLASKDIWWYGPRFLYEEERLWSSSNYTVTHSLEDLELKGETTLISTEENNDLFSGVSSWSKLLKIVTIIAKWLPSVNSPVEIRKAAVTMILRYVQTNSSLASDLKRIESGETASTAVLKLNPYIDQSGLLRAKGRLSNSVTHGNSHLVILPKKHHVVDLLIRHFHLWLSHAGPNFVLYQLSLQYWILSGRQVVRRVINSCTVCFRAKPKPSNPPMGDLPHFRVNPAPPFYFTGMDFCGPWLIKSSRLRKAPLVKAYLCIFICMTVKAVHIEVAHDLSALEFIDCLKRFISRRGIPNTLFSDCGTNFIGSKTLLQRQMGSVLSGSDSHLIREFALDNNINFKFSCPSAPHMGGLMERAVQSTKYHLKRVVGAHVLTEPQFTSLVIQIEGILNSRPLTHLLGEPGDSEVLTPGHFLIGRPITSFPQEDLTVCNENSLRHYHLIQALYQRFWKKWRLEYLSTLQARAKWYSKTPNLTVGDIVIVDEPNTPPLQWPLGKIVKVMPGQDGVVRRAVVKTSSGQYERPSVKLYRLPIQSN